MTNRWAIIRSAAETRVVVGPFDGYQAAYAWTRKHPDSKLIRSSIVALHAPESYPEEPELNI